MISLLTAALLAAADPSASPPPPAVSAPAAAPAPATAQKPKDDPNKIVCRNQESYGSRMTTRVCKTKKQWVDEEEAAQRMLRDVGSKSTVTPPESAPVL